ncbi:hypothetical protein HYALB_00008488 [Hymenoscyphus albidus]|uniref:Uncharacterized protein n=1 Tax=Hymenoscyphus albidus TaxID=595503 RepID=A0A9N9LQR0_9HELO|nr:hypothetical protein HYALB_00008488 [Hymenoscyphus albidus]
MNSFGSLGSTFTNVNLSTSTSATATSARAIATSTSTTATAMEMRQLPADRPHGRALNDRTVQRAAYFFIKLRRGRPALYCPWHIWDLDFKAWSEADLLPLTGRFALQQEQSLGTQPFNLSIPDPSWSQNVDKADKTFSTSAGWNQHFYHFGMGESETPLNIEDTLERGYYYSDVPPPAPMGFTNQPTIAPGFQQAPPPAPMAFTNQPTIAPGFHQAPPPGYGNPLSFQPMGIAPGNTRPDMQSFFGNLWTGAQLWESHRENTRSGSYRERSPPQITDVTEPARRRSESPQARGQAHGRGQGGRGRGAGRGG